MLNTVENTLTEFLGHSVLLHEPEAQGAEGVALGGFHQSEGIKVPVVGCPQYCLHLWDGCCGYVGQMTQLPTRPFLFLHRV